MNIRALTSLDIDRIATIHQQELPEDFCALLGFDFLSRIFYPEVLRTADVSLGCADENNTVQGFAIFTSDQRLFRHLVLRYPLRIFSSIARATVRRPQMFRYGVEVFVLLLTPDRRLKGSEFLYLAVASRHRGTWLWLELLTKAFILLKARGITHCWTHTLSEKNAKLYERAGFMRLKTYIGRVYMTLDLRV